MVDRGVNAQFEIAVIGAGNVGLALARTFLRADAVTRVTLGVRRPEPLRAKFEPEGFSVETPAEAIVGADIVVLAVPGNVAVAVAVEHAAALAGKVLIDCNNPVARAEGGLRWDPPAEGSLAQALAAAAPEAQVVKAFNGFGAEFHADPQLPEGPVDLLYAGDDADAKSRVHALAESAGFAPVDAGPLRNASLLENMAILWIHLAMFGGQGRTFAFGLRRR